MKNIPLFDLKRQHQTLEKKIFQSWRKAYQANAFTSGKETENFEKKYAQFCHTKSAVGVHSGTDSLIISLKAAGIGPGDEVITTPCTFAASADCIVHVGAKPVFADVDPSTGNIDPREIAKKITKLSKAILLVHLYGVPCEMDEILNLAKKHHLLVIEDASHAHGSLYKKQPTGSFGLAGCFSLYPSKSLGALGNAGIIVSNNESFLKKARMYANHGIKDYASKYVHHLSGFNKLIDNLQSAALLEKMPLLKKTIARKKTIADAYNKAFKTIGLAGMVWPKYTSPSIYVYAFQAKNRNKVKNHFEKAKISTGIYYPIPLHLQPSMVGLGYKKGDYPNAELFFNQTLSLPLFPELTEAEIAHVIKTIKTLNEN